MLPSSTPWDKIVQVSPFRLEAREHNHDCAVAGERLMSVLALFVSNCKWHYSTDTISSSSRR
jgi:hypothetical protein